MYSSHSSGSRRNFLRILSGSVSIVTAGCLGLDQLQRSASDSRDRSVTESNPEHTAESFSAYVERMREQYGDYGVWGLNKKRTGESEGGMEKISFVGAWSGGWTLRKPQTPTDGRQLRIPMDYAVALYRVHGPGEQGRSVHRLWQWAAARPKQSDEGYGRTALVELSVGISLDGSAVLNRYAPRTNIGPDSAPVRIGLSGPGPEEPTALLPIAAGRIQPSPDTAIGAGGMFAVDWVGGYGATVSVAGVCDIRRVPGREYEFTLMSKVSGTQATL